ncbi:MAG: sortase [Clostridiales bacterium]|nr:sortase [Clostridiales bacterium]
MNKRGNLFIAIGLLFIAAAFGLTAYNFWDNGRAEKAAAGETAVLSEKISEAAEDSLDNFTSDAVPLYVRYPDMEMPTVEINGSGYIGILEIPSLGLKLPVKGDYSLAGLKEAPCRYSGSVYKDNMIICGHNYNSHFGSLKNLEGGAEVSFTDGDGNLFAYQVVDIVQIDGNDVEGMEESSEADSWDMTLFTCTLSGQKRVTVRLERLSKNLETEGNFEIG